MPPRLSNKGWDLITLMIGLVSVPESFTHGKWLWIAISALTGNVNSNVAQLIRNYKNRKSLASENEFRNADFSIRGVRSSFSDEHTHTPGAFASIREKRVFRAYAVGSRKCINSLTHAQRTSAYWRMHWIGSFRSNSSHDVRTTFDVRSVHFLRGLVPFSL